MFYFKPRKLYLDSNFWIPEGRLLLNALYIISSIYIYIVSLNLKVFLWVKDLKGDSQYSTFNKPNSFLL